MSELGAQSIALPRRPLGRGGVSVPSIIWEIQLQSVANFAALSGAALMRGADWFFVPAELETDLLPQIAAHLPLERATLVLGIDGAQIRGRRIVLEERLARLGRASCAAVLLENVSTDEVRTGVPFHRLYPLRDRGLFKGIWVDAVQPPDALWLVESSPAAAVVVPYGIVDQSICHQVIPASREMGTGLIARPNRATAPRDLSFIAGESAIASTLVVLPAGAAELAEIFNAMAQPMDAGERESAWQTFAAAHPAPARKSRHSSAEEMS